MKNKIPFLVLLVVLLFPCSAFADDVVISENDLDDVSANEFFIEDFDSNQLLFSSSDSETINYTEQLNRIANYFSVSVSEPEIIYPTDYSLYYFGNSPYINNTFIDDDDDGSYTLQEFFNDDSLYDMLYDHAYYLDGLYHEVYILYFDSWNSSIDVIFFGEPNPAPVTMCVLYSYSTITVSGFDYAITKDDFVGMNKTLSSLSYELSILKCFLLFVVLERVLYISWDLINFGGKKHE